MSRHVTKVLDFQLSITCSILLEIFEQVKNFKNFNKYLFQVTYSNGFILMKLFDWNRLLETNTK